MRADARGSFVSFDTSTVAPHLFPPGPHVVDRKAVPQSRLHRPAACSHRARNSRLAVRRLGHLAAILVEGFHAARAPCLAGLDALAIGSRPAALSGGLCGPASHDRQQEHDHPPHEAPLRCRHRAGSARSSYRAIWTRRSGLESHQGKASRATRRREIAPGPWKDGALRLLTLAIAPDAPTSRASCRTGAGTLCRRFARE